jgi:hypothetical protein
MTGSNGTFMNLHSTDGGRGEFAAIYPVREYYAE